MDCLWSIYNSWKKLFMLIVVVINVFYTIYFRMSLNTWFWAIYVRQIILFILHELSFFNIYYNNLFVIGSHAIFRAIYNYFCYYLHWLKHSVNICHKCHFFSKSSFENIFFMFLNMFSLHLLLFCLLSIFLSIMLFIYYMSIGKIQVTIYYASFKLFI
jgi:hypothetical protein